MTMKDETAALSRASFTPGPDGVSARLSTEARAPRWLAAGGILAAIGAASCCVIPFALFTLGVSGAWIGNLTAREPYQPIFALVSLGLIGWGAYRVYSKPKDVCLPGSHCSDPKSDRLAKIGLWSAGAMSSSLSHSPMSPGPSCRDRPSKLSIEERAMLRFAHSLIVAGLLVAPVSVYAADVTTVLSVHNASCPLCPGIVKKTLARVKGVKSVQVTDADDSGTLTATIDYDNALATPDALIKATTGNTSVARTASFWPEIDPARVS